MGTGRLIAIGDVHGCVHALDAVLESLDPASDDRIVFLGDMIDQGRESREVLERIIDLKQQCEVVLIQGNHEEMLYAARQDKRRSDIGRIAAASRRSIRIVSVERLPTFRQSTGHCWTPVCRTTKPRSAS